MHCDVLVLGAGPAGLALARATARKGLAVRCVAPAPHRPWERSFGVWACELASLGDLALVEHTWSAPRVELGRHERVVLDVPYARLDVPALQEHLLRTSEADGVRLESSEARDVEHGPAGARVTLADGRILAADVVVDATGGASPWIERAAGVAVAHQSAYGQVVEVRAHPWSAGEMTLMGVAPLPGETTASTFLYALPLAKDRVFVEETSLVARPPVSHGVLATRLTARLAQIGIVVERVIDTELCLIPMGVGLPHKGQAALAFGAAAGLTHPATGYQFARALGLVPAVAAALASGGDPRSRVRRAYEVIWPNASLRSWSLFTLGMEVLLDLGGAGLTAFLRAFFDLPRSLWLPFLRGTSSPVEILWTMLGVLRRADAPTRRSLLRAVSTQDRALAIALSWRSS